MIGGNLEMELIKIHCLQTQNGDLQIWCLEYYILIYTTFFFRMWYNAFLEGALEYSSLSFFWYWGGSCQHVFTMRNQRIPWRWFPEEVFGVQNIAGIFHLGRWRCHLGRPWISPSVRLVLCNDVSDWWFLLGQAFQVILRARIHMEADN